MRYMMLIHHDNEALAKADQGKLGADYGAFNEALKKVGAPGLQLQPATAATSVRTRGGKSEVLDGPYADTREQLAGYFTIDVEDLDAAIAWANRCPSSHYGTIEIRPIADGGK